MRLGPQNARGEPIYERAISSHGNKRRQTYRFILVECVSSILSCPSHAGTTWTGSRLALKGKARCPLPEQVRRQRYLSVLSSECTPHGLSLLDTTPKPQQCYSVTHGERTLFTSFRFSGGFRPRGDGINNKAGEI